MPYLMQMDDKGVMAQGWELGESTKVFGRDDQADVTIGDAAMSRKHFAVTFREGRHEITDLSSSNGIRLNGDYVTNTALRAGDVIEAGKTKFYYDIGMDTMINQDGGQLGRNVQNELRDLYAELE